MTRSTIFLILTALATAFLFSCRHDAEFPPVVANVGDSIFFDSQVLPIFVSNCAMSGCHIGNGEAFALESYEQIKKKVEPGNPGKSELYQVITTNSPFGNVMPPDPKPRLTNEQVTIIQLWILEGAKNTSSSNYCDSVHVNYSGTIKSIIDNNCISCHSGAYPEADLSLDSFDNLKTAFITKSALDHLLERDGYSIMPPTGALQSCNIAQIKKWINDGLPNN
jgi:hypothetical protein